MLKLKIDHDWLFRSLTREEFEKLEPISEQEIQEALDRGRPPEFTYPTMIDVGVFRY